MNRSQHRTIAAGAPDPVDRELVDSGTKIGDWRQITAEPVKRGLSIGLAKQFAS